MSADQSALRLAALTRLARRLAEARDTEPAAEEVGEALSTLGVASAVVALEGDVVVIQAVHVPAQDGRRLSPTMAARLVGTRAPLDAIESLRTAVKLRRPYLGPAGAVAALHGIADDAGLVAALPSANEELDVAAVPVMARDRVLGVIAAWGPGCEPELLPTLEAVAAMLASAWPDTPAPVRPRRRTLRTPSSPQLRSAVTSILAPGRITAAVQPIVRLLDATVVGYEALARFPPHASFGTPEELFAAASALSMQTALDRACLRAAFHQARHLGRAHLFVNVLISTLLDDRDGIATLLELVHDAGIDPSAVVMEFSEREPVPDLDLLQRVAAELRSHGFQIAVDDAGAGHASMRVIAELRPEFIKVDRSLIHGVDSDRARRALVVSLLSFSGHIGARLIAEGIETDREQRVLLSLGVQFGQGHLLASPVLAAPVVGLSDVEVVDAGWFAQRPVARLRTEPAALADARLTTRWGPESGRVQRGRRGLARALSDAALALQSEHDPLRILGVMAEQMRRVVPVEEMAIYVADYDTHRFVPVLATGPEQDEILADSFSLDAGLTGWAFETGVPVNVKDTSEHPAARQIPGTEVVRESLLLIPLVAGERKLGMINCYRLGVDRFSNRELEAASLFAHVAAAAWRNAQLYSDLVDAAMTDPLTGLKNSRWLREVGPGEIARSQRDQLAFSLLLLDLDHFKQINDSCGHAAGDLVLQRVANRLRLAVRAGDTVVRLGGEEFIVLLHGCAIQDAVGVAEMLRTAIREISLPEDSAVRLLSGSVGVATFPEHGEDLDALLAAADRAMYAAKQCGRDRVMAAEAAPGVSILPLPRLAGDEPELAAEASGTA